MKRFRGKRLATFAAIIIAGCGLRVALAADKEIVITIDDLPSSHSLEAVQMERLHDDLLDALASSDVPAIGFVNEAKLENNDAGRKVLRRWKSAGLELGNHGYSHLDLHKVGVQAFLADIDKGDDFLQELYADDDGLPQFFRHPFLHTGRDTYERSAIRNHLAATGYRVAPVTIDNSEWIYALAYEKAIAAGDEGMQARLGQDYVRYMLEKTVYFEGNSRTLFGRDIPQVLLIHANRLNGDWLDELLEGLSARGYRFIDLATALRDEAYASDDDYFGQAGITWLHRWAITRKMPRDFYAGEPRTPEWVLTAAGMESE